MTELPFWPFLLILFLSAVTLYARAINLNSWSLLFRSTYNSRAAAQLIREENSMDNSFSGLLVFIFFLSLALFFYNLQLYVGFNSIINYPIFLYLLILFLLFIFYIAKAFVLYGLQYIFELREAFDEYIVVFMNINIVLGIWLIPLNLLYSYGIGMPKSVLLIISGTLMFAAFLLLNFRVFEMGIRNKMKWYNIILYLCTLEIMPIILIIMLVKKVGINLNIG